jgi:hypothetical protein
MKVPASLALVLTGPSRIAGLLVALAGHILLKGPEVQRKRYVATTPVYVRPLNLFPVWATIVGRQLARSKLTDARRHIVAIVVLSLY